MALAVETPAREDLSFRTNDDKRVGARWYKSDGITPVVISSAKLALRFDVQLTFDEEGNPLPLPPAEIHEIDSNTPGDPLGWIDGPSLAQGIVLAQIPHGIWADFAERTGAWDLLAVGEGLHRILVRGRFVVEEGIST